VYADGVRAVVFDLDGVLIDSMATHAEAYRRVLAPGVAVSDRDVYLREGARSETILRDLLHGAGRMPSAAQIKRLADEKQRIFQALPPPRPYAGSAALLATAWEAGVATALVTGTRRANVEAIAPDWVQRFDALQTQETYKRDKPHPEPYANAARALGVAPRDCIAIENAIRGVQSARAAGYGTVLAICTTLTAPDLAQAGPDAVFRGHEALTEDLRRRLRTLVV
jgi:HAD superfamily hydrolase (TIGR01509 family)